MKATHLKTAHLIDPVGIDIKTPLLTWTCEGGIEQSAFQIEAFSGGTPVWNSGIIQGSEMQVTYLGPAKSRLCIDWRVKLWDEKGTEGAWSECARFEYALLNISDRHAKWIDPEISAKDQKERQPASVLRKDFTLDRLGKTRIYATAHGIYTLYLNGRRITDHVLTPGTSEYWYRLPYQTFDVSEYLHLGRNRLEVVLGDGWWRGCNGNTGTLHVFGSDIALWLQMDMDGETILMTDESWQAAQDGPIRFNDLQLGERVDARCCPGIFHEVTVKEYGTGNFVCANTVPLKEKESFSARLIITPSGKKVLDFGQNMAGYVSFRMNAQDGQKIRMTHGEFIGQDGEFSDNNLQTIGRKSGELHQVVEYICKSEENEYTPTLCIFGFQYVLVETDLPIDGSEFTAHAVYSDMEETAAFTCSNALVSQLFRNAVWSMKSNFVDIPTDCPQRERSGWTGDAALFCSTGLMLMDCYPVYARWLAECRASQYKDGRVANISPRRSSKPSFMDSLYDGSSAWGDASIIVPYTLWKYTGDRRILEENYVFGKRWFRYCERKAKRKRPFSKYLKNPYRNYIIDTGMHYGEWLEAGISMADAMKDIIFHGAPDVATAYYAQSARMLSEIADALGKARDAAHFSQIAEAAAAAYRSVELPDGRINGSRQCRYVRPLMMGLLSEKEAQQAASDLNQLVISCGYHPNTGFLTTAHLCTVLSRYGYDDTAYRQLLQEDAPGWLYQVRQGATTVWESWEGNTGSTGVASLNHYSKGAVVSWLIESVCGIHAEGRQITIAPHPHHLLNEAKASLAAPCGQISSKWRYDGQEFEYTVVIPPNTTGVLVLPDGTRQPLKVGINRIRA